MVFAQFSSPLKQNTESFQVEIQLSILGKEKRQLAALKEQLVDTKRYIDMHVSLLASKKISFVGSLHLHIYRTNTWF